MDGRGRAEAGCKLALATILKGATLIELDPPLVETADLRIESGLIVARGPALPNAAGDEVIELAGRKWSRRVLY